MELENSIYICNSNFAQPRFFSSNDKKVSSSLPNFYTNPTVEDKKANYICVIHTIYKGQINTYVD